VAVLVDIGRFERLRKLDEEFERLRATLTGVFSGRSESQVEALVDEAVKSVRADSAKESRLTCE